MRRFPAPPAFEVFAVDARQAQLVWRRLPDHSVTAVLRPAHGRHSTRRILVDHNGSAGAMALAELHPSTTYELRLVASGQGSGSAAEPLMDTRFTTLAELPGKPLLRLATVNDVHIGSHRFGVSQMMKERPTPPVTSGERCAEAAFDEIATWKPDRLIVKGDFIQNGRGTQWDFGRELLERLGVPWDYAIGNHESHDAGSPEVMLAAWGYDCSEPVRVRDLDGVRVIVADTALPDSDRCSVQHLHTDIIDAAADADVPVMVFLHHNLQPRRLAWMLPSGVPGPEASALLDGLHRARPAAMVLSGHTHRHRRRDHRGIPVVEVGSTKDYPGVWAGYEVYESGVRQVVRRVARPDCIEWTEHTRKAVLGAWGRWSRGELSDRCFTHPWPS